MLSSHQLPQTEPHRNLRVIQILTEESAAEVCAYIQSAGSSSVLIDSDQQICNEFDYLPSHLDTLIAQGIAKAVQQYADEVPEFAYALRDSEVSDEGYQPLSFSKGHYHTLMTEGTAAFGPSCGRILTIHLWLNDTFRGGDFYIFPDTRPYQPRVGYAVIFPATWEYSYYTKEVEAGIKYCIYTFIRRQVSVQIQSQKGQT